MVVKPPPPPPLLCGAGRRTCWSRHPYWCRRYRSAPARRRTAGDTSLHTRLTNTRHHTHTYFSLSTFFLSHVDTLGTGGCPTGHCDTLWPPAPPPTAAHRSTSVWRGAAGHNLPWQAEPCQPVSTVLASLASLHHYNVAPQVTTRPPAHRTAPSSTAPYLHRASTRQST